MIYSTVHPFHRSFSPLPVTPIAGSFCYPFPSVPEARASLSDLRVVDLTDRVGTCGFSHRTTPYIFGPEPTTSHTPVSSMLISTEIPPQIALASPLVDAERLAAFIKLVQEAKSEAETTKLEAVMLAFEVQLAMVRIQAAWTGLSPGRSSAEIKDSEDQILTLRAKAEEVAEDALMAELYLRCVLSQNISAIAAPCAPIREERFRILPYFEMLTAAASFVSGVLQDQAYRNMFAQIITNTSGLQQGIEALASLIRSEFTRDRLYQASTFLETARLHIKDAHPDRPSPLPPLDSRVASMEKADSAVMEAIGKLNVPDPTDPLGINTLFCSTGLLTLAVTTRIYVKKRLYELTNKPYHNTHWSNLWREMHGTLSDRCLTIERLWDARKEFITLPGGNMHYRVDGRTRAISTVEDPNAIFRALQEDRETEIHPTVHGIYKTLLKLNAGITGRILVRLCDHPSHPGSGLGYVITVRPKKIHRIEAPALSKWFEIATPVTLPALQMDSLRAFEMAAPITLDHSPIEAMSSATYSRQDPLRYPAISVPMMWPPGIFSPGRGGKILICGGMFFWLRDEFSTVVSKIINAGTLPAEEASRRYLKYFGHLPHEEVTEPTFLANHAYPNIIIDNEAP